jgi:hypothetical protein
MPKLHEVELKKLHPTQLTVGMYEVHDKRQALAAMKHHERRDFLEAHPIPAVWGPDDKLYITDHHHLARAAYEESIESGFFWVEADYSKDSPAKFWGQMKAARWAHPVDEHGVVQPCGEIPPHVQALRDDVYRSLAGFVRSAGGYEKTPTAFAEFVWADFFRSRLKIGPTRQEFEHAVKQALILAASEAAKALPGYRPRR